MFRKVIRLPAGAIKASTQPGAGMGYFVTEDVREGQPITMYAQNEIPEWVAEILKNKVQSREDNLFILDKQKLSQFVSLSFLHFTQLNCLNICRGIPTFVTITRPAAAWIPSQPQCGGMIITEAGIRRLDSPTQL